LLGESHQENIMHRYSYLLILLT